MVEVDDCRVSMLGDPQVCGYDYTDDCGVYETGKFACEDEIDDEVYD